MFTLVSYLLSCSSQNNRMEYNSCKTVEPHAISKIKVGDKSYDLKIWKEKNHNYQFAFCYSNVDFENLFNTINKPQLYSKNIAITTLYMNKYLGEKDEIKKENIIGIGIYKLYSDYYKFSFYKVVKNELYPVRELNCGATHLSSNDVLDIYSLFYSQEPTVTAVVLKEKSVMSINNKRKSHDLGENIKFFGRKR